LSNTRRIEEEEEEEEEEELQTLKQKCS